MTRELPPGSTRDPRWWHRRWLPLGRHRPEVPWPIAGDLPPLWQCRCGWLGMDMGVYARYLDRDPGPLAGQWSWMPRRVWERALQRVW